MAEAAPPSAIFGRWALRSPRRGAHASKIAKRGAASSWVADAVKNQEPGGLNGLSVRLLRRVGFRLHLSIEVPVLDMEVKVPNLFSQSARKEGWGKRLWSSGNLRR